MQFDEAKAKMQALRGDLQSAVDTITADGRYTQDSQTQQVAQAILDARAKADALRDDFLTASEGARRQLTTKLFGIPAGADPATTLSFRDAQDRVGEINNPDELAGIIDKAVLNGDTILARVAAARAHAVGATDVAGSYAASRGEAARYAELTNLPSGSNFNSATALVFSVPVPGLPNDLAHSIRSAAISDAQLRKLAAAVPAQPTKPTAKAYRPGPVGTTTAF